MADLFGDFTPQQAEQAKADIADWHQKFGPTIGFGGGLSLAPDFQRWYNQRASGIFGQEIPAAHSLYQGVWSGQDSAARWQALRQLGQSQNAMATGMAGGNPLAARAALYGGGAQAAEAIGQGASAREAEVGNAWKQGLEAHLRQMGYETALQNLWQTNRLARVRAQRGADVAALGYAQAAQDRSNRMLAGLSGLGASGAMGLASLAGGDEENPTQNYNGIDHVSPWG